MNVSAASIAPDELYPRPDDAQAVAGALLGSGGFGHVYEARYRGTTRVAVKVLHGTSHADEAARLALLREAELMRSVSSPHTVRVFGVCVSPGAPLCLVMERAAGGSLFDALRSGAPAPDWTWRLELMAGTARGLADLHEAGIVHRDLKSANVLLGGADGQAQLCDFGLARALDESQTHRAAGSFYWTAPELLLDEEPASEASDVFSLGMTLYEVATGSLPYQAGTTAAQVVRRLMREERPPLDDALRAAAAPWPDEVRAVVEACWAHDPAARPTAAEVSRRLAAVCMRQAAAARQASPPSRRGLHGAGAAVARAAAGEVGDFYCDERDVAAALAEAAPARRQADDPGTAEAQVNLGARFYHGDGVPKDLAEAARLYRLAADQGDADAQRNLGLCFYHGDGVAKDLAQAARLFRLAADQGSAKAQHCLGLCYEHGNGVPKDLTEAARLYRLAADQGDATAQRYLGLCFYHGDGVPKDLEEAARLFRLAADQGNATALGHLGFCFYHGNGVPRDLAEAVRLFRLAADQGNATAQRNLGLCYEHGNGVYKDLAEAVRLYRLAADQGDATAQGYLDRLR